MTLAWVAPASGEAQHLSGFVLEPASVPTAEIRRGGPPRDGIPALDDPKVVPAEAARWDDDELVVGVEWPGGARAYPLAILVWHELVNDRIDGRPILVSYCPLCGTALVFERRIAGREHRFGVSGLLYKSALLMFDRETDSLWSQITASAITGTLLGERLQLIRSKVARWGSFKREHPNASVLGPETGHERAYGEQPYGDYASSERLIFEVAHDRRFHPKTPTVGVRVPGGAARGYPLDEVHRAGGRIQDRVAGRRVSITYSEDAQVFEIEADPGLEVIEAYWFAWSAFHPDAEIYRAQPKRSAD